ncbi:hypothetical protein ACVWZL_003320 [Bradyrhizobium sp. GM2.4]
MSGIRSPNIPAGISIGEFIGHEIVGTTRSLKRFSYDQVLGSISALAQGMQVGGGVVFTAKTQADANLAFAAFQLGMVVGDANPAKNGIYQKSGASGTGAWTRVADLPNEMIQFTVTGGTTDAITASFAPQVPTTPGGKLYLIVPTANNTGVALSINGVTVKNSLGSTPAANTFVNGVPVSMLWDGSQYRILTSLSVDTAGVVADAIAARDAASGYATAAAGSATAAASSASALANQVHQYDTRAQAIAATIPVGVQAIKISRLAPGKPLSYATYIPGTSSGPMAFQEAGGHWWELDVSGGNLNAAWFELTTDAGDAGLMLNRFATAAMNSSCLSVIPPGNYAIATAVNFAVPSFGRARVIASGAKFTSSGSIVPFNITGGGYSGGADFVDFHVDHQGNTTAPYAFELKQAGFVNIVNPTIKCGQTNANYAAIHITQSNLSNTATGSFWCRIENPQIYSTTTDKFHQGVLMEGATNACTVSGGNFSTGEYGVFLGYLASASASPNSIRVDDAKFEQVTVGVHFHGATGTVDGSPYGLVVCNCRAETVSSFLDYSVGADTNTIEPTKLYGNTLVGVSNYINNPGHLIVDARDQISSLRGRATLAGTSVAVTFPIAQPSDHYLVFPSGRLDIQLWVSSVTANGFTINAHASYSGPVDWRVEREAF